jgi:hypothetical protein
MLLHNAFIFCETPKTEDELREIMKSHPWAGHGPETSMIHGFYLSPNYDDGPGAWKHSWYSAPDSIYVDVGFAYSDSKWIDCWRCFPSPNCLGAKLDDFDQQTRWWERTAHMIAQHIPDEYHWYRVYYGQIEDEFEPGEPEKAWQELARDNGIYEPLIAADNRTPAGAATCGGAVAAVA